jgi:hypothetical protein
MRELLRSVAPAVDPAALDVEIGPWLAGMTQLYRLTNPAAGRFKELAACRIIVATSQGVYRVQTNLQQTELLAGLRILAHDEVYTALLSTPGGALAGVSSQGKFILVDAEGIVSRMRQVTASALSMAHVLWHGRSCFVLSGQDKQIRLLDETGDVVARFSVPALLLPLAAQEVNGELWLAGGVRYQNQIYAWNLSRVMQGHADAPVILRAGKSPASHLRFVSLGGQCWLLQGCCDGHVHLYSWPQPARRKLAPEYTLCGAEALRTLEPLTHGEWSPGGLGVERSGPGRSACFWSVPVECAHHVPGQRKHCRPGGIVCRLWRWVSGGAQTAAGGAGSAAEHRPCWGRACVWHWVYLAGCI